LTGWKATLRPRTLIPDWDDFDSTARNAARAQLLSDQGQLCCYCMGSIANGAYHIEHFRPRSAFRSLTYRWSNLLASCEGYSATAVNGVTVETQRQCGQAKDDWFVAGITVDPQATMVEPLFRYRLDGIIAAEKALQPARKAAVNETIKRLNLNAPSLVERRKQLLAHASSSIHKMSRAEWRHFYLDTPAGGPFQEFWAALAYNFRKHWDIRFTEA
jgi:uncharacterized protein (TIGR02646 family)